MVEGEILPTGIDVDETSAYFGITESAEILDTLRALSPSDALCKFIEATADLILPGPIDLFAIAERLGCEGGEVYYLMADTFGLIQLADPMRRYLGGVDSMEQPGLPPPTDLVPQHLEALERFTEHDHVLAGLALAFAAGGPSSVMQRHAELTAFLADPDVYRGNLIVLDQEIQTQRTQIVPKANLAALHLTTQEPEPEPVVTQNEASDAFAKAVTAQLATPSPPEVSEQSLSPDSHPAFAEPSTVVSSVVEDSGSPPSIIEEQVASLSPLDQSLEIKSEIESELESEPEPETAPEPEPEPETAPEPEPEPETAPEPEPEPEPAPGQEPESAPEPELDLSSMTVSALKEMAGERGLTGFSKMKKADLISLLKEPESESEPESGSDLSSLTVSTLREMATERGLTGFSKMKKADLIKLLMDSQPDQGPEPKPELEPELEPEPASEPEPEPEIESAPESEPPTIPQVSSTSDPSVTAPEQSTPVIVPELPSVQSPPLPTTEPGPEPVGGIVEEPPLVFDAFESAFSEPIQSGTPEPVVDVVTSAPPPASSPPLPTHSSPGQTAQENEDKMFFGAFQSPEEQHVGPIEEPTPPVTAPPVPSAPPLSPRPVQVNINEIATGLQSPPPPVRPEIASTSPLGQPGQSNPQSPSQSEDLRAGMCTGCLVRWREGWNFCPVCGSHSAF